MTPDAEKHPLPNAMPDEQPGGESCDWNPALADALHHAMRDDIVAWFSARAAAPGMHAYALIDAGQLFPHELDLDQELTALGLDYDALYNGTPEAELAEVGPYLVALPEPGDAHRAALDRLSRLMIHGWTVSFFTSRAPDIALSMHLKAFLHGLFEDGTKVIVRFFDPRVLGALAQHAPGLRDPLLAPLGAWAYWDRALRLQTLPGEDRPKDTLRPGEPRVIPLATAEALSRAGRADHILSIIEDRTAAPGELDAFAPHLRYRIVAGLHARACECGLSGLDPEHLFCALGIRLHPEFDTVLAPVAQALADPADATPRFQAALAEVTEEQWDAAGLEGKTALLALRQAFATELLERMNKIEGTRPL